MKLPERRVLICPTNFDQFELGFGLLNLLKAWIACQPTARTACMQHEVGHSLRMAHSIIERDGPSGPQAQEGKSFALCCVDNGLQILNLPLQREIVWVPIR